MKRIATIASILLLIAPMALFAGNGRGGARSNGGPRGIHTPGTGQPGGQPQGTPGGQRLRDGSKSGTGQQKKQGRRSGQGQGQGQGSGQCQQPPQN